MSFSLLQEELITEFATVAKLYVHDQTGARVLSLINKDENKVFGINFRTPPYNSNGIAHILEHSVLCGSEKYPVKEPFVEIIKGSLQTFVNAFTYPDKTCYPCASQNLQDLYNLIDIYLDAVLHPNITEMTLRQEGWHYELEDPNEQMTFKGVVFNEMKGAYSSPEDLLMDKSRNSLFPDNAYGFDSGGDPLVIPDLTYDEFKKFHQNYYHPTNAFVYFYGDDPEEKRLEIIENAFASFSKREIDTSIPFQADFDTIARHEFRYDSAGAEEPKNYFTKNWKLSKATDTETTFAFELLEHALLGTPAAYIKRKLMESGLGEEIIGGYESELAETMFTIGLKGVKEEDLSKVEPLIDGILDEVARIGVDPDAIQASLNTLEFQNRELNTGRFPRGLALMLSSLRVWLYGGDPIDALRFEDEFKELRQKVGDPSYLKDLVQKQLIENKNCSVISLVPDPQEGERRNGIEQKRLAETQRSFSDDQIREIITLTKELKLHQETPDSDEALATIPSLSIADLDKDIKTVSSNTEANLIHHSVPTNGILYLDLGFNINGLPENLVPYVGLLTKLLLEMGTKKHDFIALTQKIGKETGGIKLANLISENYRVNDRSMYVFLRAKALPANVNDLVSLLSEILTSPDLDQKDRFKQLVMERRSSLEANLIPSGHIVVNQRLRGHFTTADSIQEQISGLDQIYFLRQLSKRIDADWNGVLADLQQLLLTLIRRDGAIASVTVDPSIYSDVQPDISGLVNALPDRKTNDINYNLQKKALNEGFSLPSQVNFVGSGYSLYDDGQKIDGSLMVINNYLQSTYLWDRIRVQGGAYGGLSSFDPYTGVFNFLSYRDPNLNETIKNYNGASNYLSSLKISPSELKKAIIGTIGDLDAYQLPDAKGWSTLSRKLLGFTDEQRQQVRDEVFTTTANDFTQFGELLAAKQGQARHVVLGSAKAIADADPINGEEFKISNIL